MGKMTRIKGGQKLPAEDAAKVPIDEVTPVTKDGPEGYSEDGQIRQPEDDETKAPYASSTSSSSIRKAENYREQDTVTENSGSGRWAIPDSPQTTKKVIALKTSRFGSPFAYSPYQGKHDFFKGLLAKHTRVLFDRVVAEASILRKCLSTGAALTNDGRIGYFCVLEEHESYSENTDSSKESNSDGSHVILHCFKPNANRFDLSLFVDPTFAAVHRTYVARNNIVDSIDSSDSSSSTSENTDADKLLNVCRVQNSSTGEIEYFVVNKGLGLLSINGVCVDPTVIAGPLPDFAVLESDHFSIFWWRTAAALDYMPSLKRKRDSEDNNEESSRKALKGDSDPSPNPQVFPTSKSWLDEYRRRLQSCEERPIKYASSITDPYPPHQYSRGEMHDSDVILAIGAVWLGLIHAKIDFAYANTNLFSFARSTRMVGMHAVKGTNHLIVPLLFNEELQALSPESEEDTAEPLEPVFSVFQQGEEEKNQENFAVAEKSKQRDPGNKNKPPLSLADQEIQNQTHKGGIGHFVLAIAEKVSRDGPTTIKEALKGKALVRLRFMDSAAGTVDKGLVRRVARNIVRNSGWLGDAWPCFDAKEEYWVKVLKQSGNKCGEHTVLNAWAYMLEIPLAATRAKVLGPSFYHEVKRLILLALRGQLDSFTIRAWMQHSKYAVDEPLSQLQQTQIENPDSPDNLRDMQTVALNEDTLNQIVNDMHSQEQATNQGHATIWGAVSITSDGATTQQSGHASNVVPGFILPPFGQDLVAGSSGSSDISASSPGPAKPPPLPQATLPPPRTWPHGLVQGLAYHKALKAKNARNTKDARKDASTIGHPSNMADYDVILGIAPIWEGLKRLGRADADFTYAGMDLFSPGGGQRGVRAVGRWSRFIMPLFFSSMKAETLEDQGRGKERIQHAGHLLLCVAELVDQQPMTVQIQIFDSRVGTVTPEQVAVKAQSIINLSGWLGVDESRTRVIYRIPIWKRVPQQVGVNTCGLHVIFNAWATMLGIPIHPNIFRRGRSSENEYDATDHRFLTLGLGIVNLALEGFMDSATIQAFFNSYGYSAEQRFGDPARSVIPVNAVGMNQDKFRRTLQKRDWSRRVAYAEARGVRFPTAAMAYLAEQELSEDQAWRALLMTGGDQTRALHWHFSQDVAGELPKPEEALSPKTPDRR
ncbi:MAG: hypothetical protein ASARMPREDX12_007977 [Alectoria sarmentosa]|nr:MAG: hypothetical protein ASARMPREDX12_007977 [Alectoria sarmentosa]